MAIDETFDVGVDTRTPVEEKDYRVPSRSRARSTN
jgi:arylsulfatase